MTGVITVPSDLGSFTSFAEFDAAYGYTEKVGFKLSEKQIEDVETCVNWKALLNKMEVGCGKTVVSTTVSLMRSPDLVIVTVPPILLTSWGQWLRRVATDVVVYAGTPAERKKLPIETARWIVVSHAIFRQEFDILMSLASSKAHAELIVDEAHFIKNPGSVLFRKVRAMTAVAALQMLTGTPVSKPLDSYAYVKLKDPDVYRTMGHFEDLHVHERDFFGNPKSYKNLDLMRTNLEKHTISRTKKELHGYDLTPIFPDCSYQLSKDHMKLYRRLVEEQLLVYDNGKKIDASSAPALRHALQQIVVNYDYFSQNPDNRAAVYDMVDQTIEETECNTLGKSKLIIWTKYKRTSAAMLAYCKKLGIKTVAAYGDSDSGQAAEDFMHDEQTRILVAQPQSAGAGLNPQYVCSEALFVEMDTVPLYARQCFGRLDRMGQTVAPRMKIAVAQGTVQVALFRDLMRNDDLVTQIEPSKDGLRRMLLGELDGEDM